MAEGLGDLIGLEGNTDQATLAYFEKLAAQSVDSLVESEPEQLATSSQAILRSVQALSKRHHKSIVDSAVGHGTLRKALPELANRTAELSSAVPRLDVQAEHFSSLFSKYRDNKLLASRKKAIRLLQNSERVVDLMELPSLLLSAVSTTPLGYSSALDLYSHIKRLSNIYSDSTLISSVLEEADDSIRQLAVDLLAALEAPNLKLAAALRTVGWLRRIMVELISDMDMDNSLQAVFLICRLSNLLATLEALDPLRQLAEEERKRQHKAPRSWSGGQQTEKYLKRFIEVFREHSFSIISISKNIGGTPAASNQATINALAANTPPALSTFPLHLIEMLMDTLRIYLPIVSEQTSRESILTQVLYCAGSLGRLGADFSVLLSTVNVPEWIDVIKRHRQLAGRLESVIGDYRGNLAEATV